MPPAVLQGVNPKKASNEQSEVSQTRHLYLTVSPSQSKDPPQPAKPSAHRLRGAPGAPVGLEPARPKPTPHKCSGPKSAPVSGPCPAVNIPGLSSGTLSCCVSSVLDRAGRLQLSCTMLCS